jgi:hypothetical protein
MEIRSWALERGERLGVGAWGAAERGAGRAAERGAGRASERCARNSWSRSDSMIVAVRLQPTDWNKERIVAQ